MTASEIKSDYDALYARCRADGERLYALLERLRELRQQERLERRRDLRDARRYLGKRAKEAA